VCRNNLSYTVERGWRGGWGWGGRGGSGGGGGGGGGACAFVRCAGRRGGRTGWRWGGALLSAWKSKIHLKWQKAEAKPQQEGIHRHHLSERMIPEFLRDLTRNKKSASKKQGESTKHPMAWGRVLGRGEQKGHYPDSAFHD